uniref:Tetratricopeptide repeat protein 29 n=1 Tax=Clastoptera arizonana TaxID=38151 RepID=A0A1B6E2T0_9HEMI
MKGSYKRINPPDMVISDLGELSDPKSKVLHGITDYQTVSKEMNYIEIPHKLVTYPKNELSLFNDEIIAPMRQQIRDGKPLLSNKEMRRVRLPLYESALQDLKEDGFEAAEKYIRHLLVLVEDQENVGDLKSSPNTLKKLINGFKKGDISKDARVLITTALSILKDDTNKNWFWLIEDILKTAVDVAIENNFNDELHAIALYIQGEFLLEKLGKVNEAEVQLLESKAISNDRMWTLSEIIDEEKDMLFYETCFLLHKVYLIQAKKIQNTDINKCIELCKKAKNLAFTTNNDLAKECTMLELIEVYIKAKKNEEAYCYIDKCLVYCKENNNTQGLCKTLLLQSTLLVNEEKLEDSIQILKSVVDEAVQSNFKYLQAAAYRGLVETYLKML